MVRRCSECGRIIKEEVVWPSDNYRGNLLFVAKLYGGHNAGFEVFEKDRKELADEYQRRTGTPMVSGSSDYRSSYYRVLLGMMFRMRENSAYEDVVKRAKLVASRKDYFNTQNHIWLLREQELEKAKRIDDREARAKAMKEVKRRYLHSKDAAVVISRLMIEDDPSLGKFVVIKKCDISGCFPECVRFESNKKRNIEGEEEDAD